VRPHSAQDLNADAIVVRVAMIKHDQRPAAGPQHAMHFTHRACRIRSVMQHAVRINDVAGISGLLQPNSRVDVLVTIREDKSERQVAKLFMSNMLVLSVGSEVQRDNQGKPINATTVTLATPS